METKKPVALWKGIVGTAVSGFVLLLIFLIYLLCYFIYKLLPDWTVILILVAFLIGLFSLIFSVSNIHDALEYKKQFEVIENASRKKEELAKSKLLHKLLSEGRITIEEYDELIK